jgi:metal-sulfur cluster biosynthetic enzyme/ribosomal protein L22
MNSLTTQDMAGLGVVDVHQEQLRVTVADARAAIAAVRGKTAVDAVAKLRYGPGRTCEPLARLLDGTLARTALDARLLVVTGGTATAAEDIVRVRRKAHGTADWISSPTADVRIELVPAGLHAVAESTVDVQAAVVEPLVAYPEPTEETPDAAAVRALLYDVLDPDLGVNIVDLGFVRGIAVHDGTAVITMTLTSPTCPLTGIMTDQIRAALLAGGDNGGTRAVEDFRVDWVWRPAWRPADISDEGRDQLRAIGFTHF